MKYKLCRAQILARMGEIPRELDSGVRGLHPLGLQIEHYVCVGGHVLGEASCVLGMHLTPELLLN